MGRKLNRRRFLTEAACGAMSATTLFDTISHLGAINGLTGGASENLSPDADYKALVCILLDGGCDTFNVLMPNGVTGHGEYVSARGGLSTNGGLAIPQADILNINSTNVQVNGLASSYSDFGIHPGMPEVRDMFNVGEVALLANVGTLVEPIVDYNDYRNGNKKLPLGIYSHSDQRMQWQSSVPQSRSALGLGGRIADLLQAQNEFDKISMNISLAGNNRFQTGRDVVEFSVSDNISPTNIGFESIDNLDGNREGFLTQIRDQAIENMATQTYQNALQKQYASLTKTSFDSFEKFKEVLKKVPSFSTVFPDTNLADDLLAVAKLISIQAELGAKRQIFFVRYGGWDNHNNLLEAQADRLPVVSQALKAFNDVLKEPGINKHNQVTTFTISDFARTITSNGQGSDHAWGGNHLVMGGAVNGQKIYGSYPSLDIDNNDLNVSSRGNFIPTLATDQFYAELALWYGVSVNDLCYVLPNLGNFYSYSTGNYPIGFMDINNANVCTSAQQKSCLVF